MFWTALGTSSCFQLQADLQAPARELITTAQGYRLALGMGGSILGRGADLIVVDDPIKATDVVSEAERRRVNDAFDSTLYTGSTTRRPARSSSSCSVCTKTTSSAMSWTKANGSLSPSRLSRSKTAPISSAMRLTMCITGGPANPARAARELPELEATRRMQGSLVFSAQYQQAPVPPEGNIVRRDWLR